MALRTIDDFDINDKTVLLRADLDVPLDNKSCVTDDLRLRLTADTIKSILGKNARQIVIMGHLHRPGGTVINNLRMNPVGEQLSKLLNKEVVKLDDCINLRIPRNDLVLLENLRFHSGEEKNHESFAKELASLGEIFVMDAFANSHRAHASTVGVMEFLPSCFGPNMIREYNILSSLECPKHPYVAIIGGKKISTKIGVITNILKKVDHLLIGGAMMFTFYKALGFGIGKSLYESEDVELAKMLMNNDKLILPEDVVVSPSLEDGSACRTVKARDIPDDMWGLDIGQSSISHFCRILKSAKTVVWNGPLGLFEIDAFAKGTEAIAKMLSEIDAQTIVGGGDSSAALKKLGLEDKMTHISTGGGASLCILEGLTLPTVAALEQNMLKFQ